MTHAPEPTPAAARRLEALARSACADGQSSVLDVGCGNGLLLPFLRQAATAKLEYRGIDLSSRMVDVAARKYGGDGAVFEARSFADCAAAGGEYDTIVFNGSLQFFADPAATLEQAASLLRAGSASRLVVAHINGGGYVRTERADNPATVLSEMPSLAELTAVCERLGLELAPWDGVELSSLGVEAAAEILDDFYLAVLERPRL